MQLDLMTGGLHPWDLTPKEAVALQRELSGRVRLEPLPESFTVLGASDLSYIPVRNLLVATVLTFQWPDLTPLETVSITAPIRFPYVPGLLSFREIPPLLEAIAELHRMPDVFLCDGQGIAHPRRFGLAAHLGLWLGLPAVGCAKSRLIGEHAPFELLKGLHAPLVDKGEIVGCVLCTRDGVKPLYVSPGHLADIESSRELVLACVGKTRIPEPLKQAHNTATRRRTELRA